MPVVSDDLQMRVQGLGCKFWVKLNAAWVQATPTNCLHCSLTYTYTQSAVSLRNEAPDKLHIRYGQGQFTNIYSEQGLT